MKLTKKEIERVLIMHLYQQALVGYWRVKDEVKEITIELLHRFNANGQGNWQIEKIQPLLIPLSKISDEHAIEVANIWRISSSIIAGITDAHVKYYFKEYGIPQVIEVFQYLISKGYAVPLWFGIGHWANGKNAIELGIAIDKTLIPTS